jgi:multiple sugar transport system ATP-binding protein
MGRAIVRKPQVFLFDEPLSNLDAKLRVAMRTEIKALHQRLKTTSIYVTHDQIEAMTMADRIVVMNAGRVEQIGSPLELYDDPANLFVAGFIGSPAMNMLPVSMNGSLRIGGAEIDVGDDLGVERATIGFRPETVVVGEGPVAGRIRIVEDLGSEAFVHLVIDHDGEECRIVAKARAPFAGSPGDNVRLGLRGSVHLFDNAEVRRKSVEL